jgi:steroid delta-isomerase-like uncharacterized protein
MSVEQLAEQWIAAMNAHDAERMAALLTEDAVGDEVAESEPRRGRDKIADGYREVFAGYPDCVAEIVNRVIGSDQAVIEVRFKGTNKGAFRGTPATNKPIGLRIAYVIKARRGKIERVTEYYDVVTLLTQQGMMPKQL